jgi:DNA replication protein DnaC
MSKLTRSSCASSTGSACALKLSGLPHHKTLAEFDYAFQPDLEPRRIKDLATLEFIDAPTSIALLGPPGVGKTRIAVALAVAACQAGHSTCFTSLDDLFRKPRIAEATGRLDKQLSALLRPSVLVVDKVGYLRLEREEANMFFQLISRRYERGSTIITPTSRSTNGAQSSATTSSPPRSSTGSSTTAKSSPSTDPATACATE